MSPFVLPAGAVRPPSRPARPRLAAAVAAAVIVLSGCASFSADGGADRVAELTRARTGQSPRPVRTEADAELARARVAELLAAPLTPDAAVELAFLQNPGLQAGFAGLGIAEADLVQAGRLRNPTLSFGRLREGGGAVEIDRAIVFDVLGLLTMPLQQDIARRRFGQAQLRVAQAAVGLAADTREAWFTAVASAELLRYQRQVMDAADASRTLAERMRAVGNVSALAQWQEQAFHADATVRLAEAGHQALAHRERLTRLLGLSDPLAFTLPERLPALPDAPVSSHDAEQAAMDRRLDVLLARGDTADTARSLGLTRATRFVNVLAVGYQNQSVTGEPRADGFEVELSLPLFDFGATRAARAEATYRQAMQRTAQVAVDARSEVREAHAAYRTRYALARHYRDEVVPLRKRISDENLLRYNGMLVSVFDLLADAREQVASVAGHVVALRDFWIAETRLQAALSGRSRADAAPAADTPATPAPGTPPAAAH